MRQRASRSRRPYLGTQSTMCESISSAALLRAPEERTVGRAMPGIRRPPLLALALDTNASVRRAVTEQARRFPRLAPR